MLRFGGKLLGAWSQKMIIHIILLSHPIIGCYKLCACLFLDLCIQYHHALYVYTHVYVYAYIYLYILFTCYRHWVSICIILSWLLTLEINCNFWQIPVKQIKYFWNYFFLYSFTCVQEEGVWDGYWYMPVQSIYLWICL